MRDKYVGCNLRIDESHKRSYCTLKTTKLMISKRENAPYFRQIIEEIRVISRAQ